MTFGAAIGWLASIMMREDTLKKSLANIAIGSVGALASYALAADKLALDTLSPEAILLGGLGAMVLLALSAILQRQIVR